MCKACKVNLLTFECLRTARRELEAIDRRQERIKDLERDRDALLDSLVAASPDALEALTSEERLNVYQMLGLRVILRQDGGLEASGTLMDTPSVCTPTVARA